MNVKSILTGIFLGLIFFGFYYQSGSHLSQFVFNDTDIVYHADTGDFPKFYKYGDQPDYEERDEKNKLRHLLFRPTTGWLYRLIKNSFSLEADEAIVVLFAFLASLNIMLAYAFFVRLNGKLVDAGFFALLYGFSFSNVVFLSIPETIAGTGIAILLYMHAFLSFSRGSVTLASSLVPAAFAALAGLFSLHMLSLLAPGFFFIVLTVCKENWPSDSQEPIRKRRAGVSLIVLGLLAIGLSFSTDYLMSSLSPGFGLQQIVLMAIGIAVACGGALLTVDQCATPTVIRGVRRNVLMTIDGLIYLLRPIRFNFVKISSYILAGTILMLLIVAIAYALLSDFDTTYKYNRHVINRYSSVLNLLNVYDISNVLITFLLYSVVSPVSELSNVMSLENYAGYFTLPKFPIIVTYVSFFGFAIVRYFKNRSDFIESLAVWMLILTIFHIYYLPDQVMLWSAQFLLPMMLFFYHTFIGVGSRYKYVFVFLFAVSMMLNNTITLYGG